MMGAKKLRWGVLSTAGIGRTHVIPAMQSGELTEVVAIASRDAARAAKMARELGIAKSYGSYEELLADPEIDAIYNPLPNHLHAHWTIRALDAGKHVLTEKPVALNAQEAADVLAAQRRTGRVALEAFMVRFHPQWEGVRDIVKSGRIGEVRAMQTIFSYYLTDPHNIRNQAEIGGGGLYDIGCYAINTARYLFDGEPERVIGLFDIDPNLATDRLTSALAEFSGHRHLAFTCSTQLSPCQRVQVLGTAGRIEIAIPFNPPAGAEASICVDDGSDLSGSGREIIEFPIANQYTLQGDAFARAVMNGNQLPWDITDAVKNMQVLDALFRSGKSGRWEITASSQN
ncbi:MULTISPECIES: Gfo/Idh/MocA family oxidoreductase [unclassified Rhizobium]|uniref:Gfo/Idh/MocA family protein n=1 Tax=unclassified Rhizobium TaxID=2613769 RepID=UPI001FDA6658|nr:MULTISPECIES: Gfo/Idh/MocA family oxidoreductase [unclassified Rhizobium]MBP2463864.1 putative dehydrogenase [Rhizobium sp. PvP014]MBP2532091.1 putative dehydrogenase [Rhizobium sp. PvP099]